MTQIPVKQIQPLLLEILIAFHEYCVRHSLKYFLSDGTLLGAVRHKGFIPWDDDIDVSMIDSQYDRLLELAKKEPFLDEEKRYRFLLPAELPNFYPFIKVVDTSTIVYEKDIDRQYAIGLWVDVFRLSHCDSDFSMTQRKYKRIKRLREINKLAVCGDFRTPRYKAIAPFVKIVKTLLNIAGKNPIALSRQMQKIEEGMPMRGHLLMDITWADSIEHFFDESLWRNSILIDFCGKQFYAPKKYDGVLTAQFGDYMQLPPEKDRIRHDFEAYYLN